jgi:hypothetical protein
LEERFVDVSSSVELLKVEKVSTAMFDSRDSCNNLNIDKIRIGIKQTRRSGDEKIKIIFPATIKPRIVLPKGYADSSKIFHLYLSNLMTSASDCDLLKNDLLKKNFLFLSENLETNRTLYHHPLDNWIFKKIWMPTWMSKRKDHNSIYVDVMFDRHCEKHENKECYLILRQADASFCGDDSFCDSHTDKSDIVLTIEYGQICSCKIFDISVSTFSKVESKTKLLFPTRIGK